MNAYLPASVAELWSIAGWTMVHFLWLGALVGAAAAVCRLVLRRANANLRYAVTVAWLAVLVALPVGIAGWLVRNSGPAPAGDAVVAAAEPVAGDSVSEPTDAPAAEEIIELHRPEQDGESDNQIVAQPTAPGSAGGIPDNLEPRSRAANPRQSRGLSGVTASALFESVAARLESWIAYLPWVWIVGTPITFGLLATGVIGGRRLRRASRVIDDGPIAEILARLVESLHITRRVTVAVCERIAAPVLIGIVRPMILLPPSALTGWSPDEIEMVLLHELAHVRRWDNLVNLLQRFVESLLFFHPAVWLVSSWVRREREACCDAVVVGRTNRPHAYAEMLVALAAQMPRSVLFHPAASSAMAAGPLRSRIRRILQVEDDPMLVSGKSLAIVLGSLLVAGTLAVLYVPTIGHAEESTTEGTESTEGKQADKRDENSDLATFQRFEQALQYDIVIVALFNDKNHVAELDKLRKELAPHKRSLDTYGIKLDASSPEAKRYNLSTDPTCIVFIGGKEAARLDSIRSADQLQDFVRTAIAETGDGPLTDAEKDLLQAEVLKGISAVSESNPVQTRAYNIPAPVRKSLRKAFTEDPPLGADGHPAVLNWDGDWVEITTTKAIHDMLIAQLQPAGVTVEEAANSEHLTTEGTEGTESAAAGAVNPDREVLAVVSQSELNQNPNRFLELVAAAKKRGLYVDREEREGDNIALVVVPAPKEADWPAMLGESPRKERVIAEKAWQRLGLKLVPLNRVDSMYQEMTTGVGGLQIVGGNVPKGLPLPAILTNVGREQISNIDGLLLWLESEWGRVYSPVKCYATVDGKQYLFEAGPAEIKAKPQPTLTLTNVERKPVQAAQFPSLEDQKLFDLAFKRLGVELEALSDDELKRVQALGYEGGVKVAQTNGSLQPNDILVGLHVWPTTSIKDVATILERDDLAELNPLKFYAIRQEGATSRENPNGVKDFVRSGRITVRLDNRSRGGEFGGGPPTTPASSQRPPAAAPTTATREQQNSKGEEQQSGRATEGQTPAASPERTVAAYDVPKVLAAQAERLIANAGGRSFWDDRGRFVVQATKDTHEHFSRNLAATPKWRQPAAAQDRAAKPIDVKTIDGKTILEWRTLGLTLEEQANPQFKGGSVVVVTEVDQGSPAAWYGLRPGNHIASLMSFDVSSVAETRSVLESLLNGFKGKEAEVHINIRRFLPEGKSYTRVTVTLPLHPDAAETPRGSEGWSSPADIAPPAYVESPAGAYRPKEPIARMPRPATSDPFPATNERSVVVNPSNGNVPIALPAGPPATAPVIAPPTTPPLENADVANVPPTAANADELAVLREQLKAIEQQYQLTEALYKEGRRGGETEIYETQGYELALARGELALAEGNRDKAIEEFQDASGRAQKALDAVQERYKSGNVSYDVVLQAIRNLSDVKLKLIGLQKKTRAETAPAATYETTVSRTPVGPLTTTTANKANLRYDGKAFGTWRDTWKTELSTEKRLEAIKALAAFGRAGYGKEAVEAILDVAAEYDFHAIDGSSEAKLKNTVVNELAPSNSRSMAEHWMPELAARLKKEPKKWAPLANLLFSRLQTDDAGAIEVLQTLAESGPEDVRNMALAAVIRSAQTKGNDPRLDDKAKKLIDAALASRDPDTVASALRSIVYRASMAQGSPYKVIYRPAMLASLLFHPNQTVRNQARAVVGCLEARDAEQIAQDMRAVLGEKSRAKDHVEAIRALGALGPRGEKVVGQLEKLLLDDSQDLAVRVAAAFAIDRIESGTRGQNLLHIHIEPTNDEKFQTRLQRLLQEEQQM